MGLVVHAVHALDRGLLHLVDDLAALASVHVDPAYRLVVHLQFEVLRPVAVCRGSRVGRGARRGADQSSASAAARALTGASGLPILEGAPP
jgi:hypothetical protein